MVSIDFAFERYRETLFHRISIVKRIPGNERINPNEKILKTDCCSIDLPEGTICVCPYSEHLVILSTICYVSRILLAIKFVRDFT